jgi:hypothetical protein
MTLRHLERLDKINARAARQGSWGLRHARAFEEALACPNRSEPSPEAALARLIAAWMAYADAHRDAYGSKLGADGFLGPKWRTIGEALRGLLHGDLGRMDASTLREAIDATLDIENETQGEG